MSNFAGVRLLTHFQQYPATTRALFAARLRSTIAACSSAGESKTLKSNSAVSRPSFAVGLTCRASSSHAG
jgi:hypothetical protein